MSENEKTNYHLNLLLPYADPEETGGPDSLFELSYILVKRYFNTIFPISSLSYKENCFLCTMFCNFRFELRLGIFWFFLKQIVLKSNFFQPHHPPPPEKTGPPFKKMSGSASDCTLSIIIKQRNKCENSSTRNWGISLSWIAGIWILSIFTGIHWMIFK